MLTGGRVHQLVVTDRVFATWGSCALPHAALSLLYDADRSTNYRAVCEIRSLLAARGFAVLGEAGLRLHTLRRRHRLMDVALGLTVPRYAYRARRPVGRPPRVRIRQNAAEAKKATPITDQGASPVAGAIRPGRMHDQNGGERQGDRVPLMPNAGAGPGRGVAHQIRGPPKKPAKAPPPRRSRHRRRPASTSPHSGSASSTPTPSTSSGDPPAVYRRHEYYAGIVHDRGHRPSAAGSPPSAASTSSTRSACASPCSAGSNRGFGGGRLVDWLVNATCVVVRLARPGAGATNLRCPLGKAG